MASLMLRLAAAVRADDGGDPLPVEAQLGAVAKGFKSLYFDAFEFQQSLTSLARGSCNYTKRVGAKVKHLDPNPVYP